MNLTELILIAFFVALILGVPIAILYHLLKLKKIKNRIPDDLLNKIKKEIEEKNGKEKRKEFEERIRRNREAGRKYNGEGSSIGSETTPKLPSRIPLSTSDADREDDRTVTLHRPPPL